MIFKDVNGFSLKISEQPWDSEMFGFGCGSLEISTPGTDPFSGFDTLASAIAEVIDRARTAELKFLTLKVDAGEIWTINSALRNAGTLIDTEITFSKDRVVDDVDPRVLVLEGYSIHKLEKYWDDSLYELTDTLRHSRFFADRHIATDVARKVWRNSIYNSCNGRASYSIVCVDGQRPVGLMNVFDRGEISDIFLIAVSPAHQGKGVGRAMMDVYEKSLGRETRTQTVETQLVNYGAQRLYVGRGYRASQAKHTIHFWL